MPNGESMQSTADQPIGRELSAWEILKGLNTSEYSFVHWFSRSLCESLGKTPTWLIAGVVGIAATLLPLLASSLHEFPWPALLQPAGNVKLPLLKDLNVLFMFAVSLPLILAFVADDQRSLIDAIAQVVREDILVIPPASAKSLAERWIKRFKYVNYFAQALALLVGLAVAFANYQAYRDPTIGLWTTGADGVSRTGWIYVYAVFVFYWVATVFVIRSVWISLFLRDLVLLSTVNLVPFHPDHCSGLRPVGTLGLRNQYTLSITGINLLLLYAIYPHYLGALPNAVEGLLVAALVAYIVCGPVIFAGPLFPFSAGMKKSKNELVDIVARRLQVEMALIRSRLVSGEITKEDEELVERLRKIGAFVEEFPVWPFDARTLGKFATAYMMPLLASVAIALLKEITTLLKTMVT
jgi:hypothetical protein